jgi:hypothetical protein
LRSWRRCSREGRGFATLRGVNFFAHAYLAAERSADAAFVLGAMLPDLCAFAGLRLGAAPCAALGDGVRFHRETDALFHADAAFNARCTQLSDGLQARGVRRGPARGVAHVAHELLLDGWLAREAGVPALYRRALGEAAGLLGESGMGGSARDDVTAVCTRLHAAPVPEAYVDPAFVCARVERALAARPYLALAAHERSAVASALDVAASECAAWAPGALASVQRALSTEPLTENP